MPRKYTKKLLENLAKESFSRAEICEKLGVSKAGSSANAISRRLVEYNVDISHFCSPRKSGVALKRF